MQSGPPPQATELSTERLENNLSRLRVATLVGLVVHVAHVLLFSLSSTPGEPPTTATWHADLMALHGSMLVPLLLFAVVVHGPERWPRLARVVPQLFVATYLVFGAAVTTADQRVADHISAFTIATLAAVLVVQLEPRQFAALMTLATSLFIGGQVWMQANPQLRLSNLVNGFTVSVVGVVMATLFARNHRQQFEQRRIIEHQRTELQRALGEAQAAALEAERANRAKSIFLATVSHEIRTPMTGVLGVTDVLARTTLDENQRELLHTVQESGSTLVTLISDLLDLSKSEAGHLHVESRPFDFVREVGAVAKLFEPKALDKGLRFSVTWAGDPVPPLLGDAMRVRQVVSNLVGNALKFTTLGGIELHGRCEVGDGRARVWLEVVDSGPGISEEVLSRLFTPWSQADVASTRTYGGTGLGLAISRQLAQTMGGQLDVSSVVDEGSTFTFSVELPLASREALGALRSTESGLVAAPQPLSGRVLVVDDNLINQRVAQGLLKQLGLDVEVAGDGAGACELLVERPFDAVVTDLHMPNMDGLQLLGWLRGQEGTLSALPVIVLTADLMPEERARCLAAGANAVMTKPFRAADLEACLRAEARLAPPEQRAPGA